MGLPNDPSFNVRDAVSREMLRKGTCIDWFGTNYPLMTLLREAGIVDLDFQGTGVRTPGIYNYTDGRRPNPARRSIRRISSGSRIPCTTSASCSRTWLSSRPNTSSTTRPVRRRLPIRNSSTTTA